MKFVSAFTVAASVAAVANAQALVINNPTLGSIWTTGVQSFIGWQQNCASMGNASHAVTIDLLDGPSTAVRYVASLGTLDCSGNKTTADVTVPNTVVSGQYSIRVNTSPSISYTNIFQINNPSSTAATTAAAAAAAGTTTGATASPTSKPNSASSVAIGSFVALTGAAVAALQLVL